MASFVEYADTVQKLIRFAEVKEFFKWHISRWRRKKSLIQVNKAKAEEALKPWARRKKTPPDWPYRRVGIGKKSRLIQVPPELQRKVEKRETLMQGSLLTRLARKPLKDLTPSERFTLLAQIHDACYANHHLGPTDLRAYEIGKGHYLASVGVLESDLAEGRRLKKIEATRLHDVLAFVLARIEAKVDPTTKDDNGELLVDVVRRLRRKWGLPSSQTVAVQSQIASAKKFKGRSSLRKTKRPAHRPPDTDAKRDAAIGDKWLAKRVSGPRLSIAEFARLYGYKESEARYALGRDKKRRRTIWAENPARGKNSVKRK